ncbi:ogr/Delta-like zinc finger family protein [Burkholderia ubonensis]|uniref:ogr/Delta-like zinc finger family protein n=1 Tax=Burkholderia ubonensis TaxID=101571 RepID=UPI0009B3411F|nr:ogr/Delta-like zinc finger family protein [Burkholderia ubonensis]
MTILNRCPHCRMRATARSSREMSITFREITYQCNNLECGHTYVVNMEFARTLSPSATPDPSLNLPISAHVRERLVRQFEPPV